MGPRRVGKTVIIHHAIQALLSEETDPKSICYLSVDNPIYNMLTLENFLHAYAHTSGVDIDKQQLYVFFDEFNICEIGRRNSRPLLTLAEVSRPSCLDQQQQRQTEKRRVRGGKIY